MAAMTQINTLKQCVIEEYYLTIKELFLQVDKSDIIKGSSSLATTLSIGVNSIHRVFEYVLLQKKNLEQASYHAKQSCYYLLEYIEQVHRSNLTHNLNNTDAVLFVYKKTIFNMHDGEESDTSSTITNILTLSDDSLNINNKEWRMMYSRILNVVNVLFYWNNTEYSFQERKTICNDLLLRYLHSIDKLDFATVYLEHIQQNFEPNYVTYNKLLNIMISKTEKMRRIRSGSVTEEEKNEHLLTKFSFNRDIFNEKYNSGNIEDLVKWLYTN